MLIRVFRKEYGTDSIIGDLYIDGEFLCHSLENTKLCIPEGKYKVILDFSNRFQKDMPHILNVPGREGIRIHPGNYYKDSSGCVLIGMDKGESSVWRSKIAYKALYDRLKAHPGDIGIEIC